MMDADGNINCRNCIGCTGCMNCSNCSNCNSCINCTNCVGCNNCNNCGNCSDCYACSNCRNCKRCTESTNCSNSSNLIQALNRWSEFEYFNQFGGHIVMPAPMQGGIPEYRRSSPAARFCEAPEESVPHVPLSGGRPSYSSNQQELPELDDEPERLQQNKECVICFDAKKTHALIPCGHKCVCETCATESSLTLCPLCKQSYNMVIRIFD